MRSLSQVTKTNFIGSLTISDLIHVLLLSFDGGQLLLEFLVLLTQLENDPVVQILIISLKAEARRKKLFALDQIRMKFLHNEMTSK